jgi:predicted RNA-binding Zn-ribbon protein involved in translation (DUF1610 family)
VSEAIAQSRRPARACPSCGEAMSRESYERKLNGVVELDVCYACHAIWFDQYESAALAPGAIMRLFEEIHDKRDATARPLAERMRCVSCRGFLKLTYDMERTNRITYYRCLEGHGRFTTFVQFLREKNFIRSLSVAEVQRLRSVVKQVRCASCGAPIDLARDAQCSYCHAPIAILDADAVTRTLAELSEAERARRSVDPAAAVDAMLAGKRTARSIDAATSYAQVEVVDLVVGALDFLMQR